MRMGFKRKNKKGKVKVLGTTFLVLLLLTFSLFAFRSTKAQVPSSTCSNTNDPEFNSLRPYPKEPCQTTISDTAKFCGNDLTLHQTVTVPYPGSGVCTTNNGKVTCKYNQSVDSSVVFNLTGANLPFMGNTEDVPNSQGAGSLTDAEKTSGYVSWYLNGVMNRAEDGSLKTVDPKTANYNAVNFSGPINKLLPSAILDAQRILTISNVNGDKNHDQIVVCVKDGKTLPCYSGDNTKAQGKAYRLNDWNDGNLSLVTTFFNWMGTEIWNKKYPPLPWQFKSEVLYSKAYSEWKGNTCAIIPIVNKLVCVALPIISNPDTWANLFPYIPLSSTEDLKGQITVDNASSATSSTVNGVTVSGVMFSGQVPSTLFFPHMKETTELASILQDTFVAESEQGNKAANPTDVSTSSTCNPVEVRSNKGDNLFATQLSGNLHYDVSFSCDFNPVAPTTNQTCLQRCLFQALNPSVCNSQCQTTPATQSCTKDIYISLSTTGAIPKANEIWSQTVAGPQSIFKRIFPKTNVAGGVGQIIDIPGSTNITYSGSGISSSNTDLKFPHIGGVSEYFLKGIQTMLRPKGYGEPITFAPTTGNVSSGNVDCDQTAPDIVLPKTVSKEELHQIAIRWQGREGDHVLECYNDVARKSLAAGISPAFTFLMWINESGGSNYNLSSQDWGINSNQIVGVTAQLTRFLQLPSAYKNIYSQCFGKTKTDTEVYFDLFAVGLIGGQCMPGSGQPYMQLLNDAWGWFTTCPMTSYPFKSTCY
jgi:hypothetical protein